MKTPPLDHKEHIKDLVKDLFDRPDTKRIRLAKQIITKFIGDKRDLQVLIDRGVDMAECLETGKEYDLRLCCDEIDDCMLALEELIKFTKEKRKERKRNAS